MWWFESQFILRNKESWPEDKFVSDATDELRSAAKSNVAVNIEFINQAKQNVVAVINTNKYRGPVKLFKISKHFRLWITMVERYSMQWHYLW